MAEPAEVAGDVPAFGDLLKRYRRAAGLTQEALAEQAGLSLRSIGDLERGLKRMPRRDTVALLAEALRLSPAERAIFARSARPRVVPAMEPVERPAARPLTPFVGRRYELSVLERHLAGEGPPLLVLAGEPGIGKSRLLGEALSRAGGWGLRILSGGCQRRGGQEPYAPLLEALERWLQGRSAAQRQDDLEGCAWLTRLLPEVAAMGVGALPSWSLTAEQERRLMFKAVIGLLTNVAGPRGTLLVLDDLQWAGADALDLLARIARAAPEARLRVLGAYRDTEAPREGPLASLLADLAHAGMVAHHTLAPLSAVEAALLLERLLGSSLGDDGTLRNNLVQRTGGVPFFLVSCADALRLYSSGGLEESVPWSVAQGVLQRAAALPAAAREVLSAAAVIGRHVQGSLLIEVVQRADDEVIEGLEEACQARLLDEAGDDTYQFPHDIVHEALRGDLGAAQRAVLHRRVAEALERRPGEPSIELLAYHYGRAHDYERAMAYLVTAAERARQRAAYRDEVELLAQAIALAERLGLPARVAELRAQRGQAFVNAEMWREAREELEAVLAVLPAAQEALHAQVLIDLAKAYWWSLDCPTSGRYAREALALAERAGRDDLAAAALTYMAQAYKSEGRMARSLALYRTALQRAGDAPLPALHESAGVAHYLVGRIDEAIRLGRGALATTSDWRDAGAHVNALSNLGLALGGGGHYDEAMKVFDEACRFGRDYELRTMLARAMACSTGVHLDIFDYAGAEARAHEAHEAARSVWLPPLVSAGIDLLFTYVRSGQVGQAEGIVDEVVRLSELPGSFHEWLWGIRLTEVRAELALARGDHEEALRLVNQSLRRSLLSRRRKYVVVGLATRACILTATGRIRPAIRDAQRAVALARALGDPAQLLRAAGVLLPLAGDDSLLAEARATAELTAAALPDTALRRRFLAAEPVRSLGRW